LPSDSQGTARKVGSVENNEFGLYAIHQELQARVLSAEVDGRSTLSPLPEIVPLLGSVRDFRRMADVFRAHSPDTVYHAAAYKHVPMVEHNACEGISNNVLGTFNVARAAIENG
jgi:FlaA1/EpsC-like NDP-sugar epimerase